MHQVGVLTFDEVRAVAVTDEQALQFVVRDARQYGRGRDLVTVEVQDGQYGAVGSWIQELVGVPCSRKRSSLGLAVTDHARRYE